MDNNLFNRAIKDHYYKSFLTSLDTLENPPYIDKFKSDIRKRVTHLDRDIHKTSVSRAIINQQYDKYDLYPVFEDDYFEVQGIWYEHNYFRVVPEMLHMNNRRVQSTVDSIWYLPRYFWLVLTNDKILS